MLPRLEWQVINYDMIIMKIIAGVVSHREELIQFIVLHTHWEDVRTLEEAPWVPKEPAALQAVNLDGGLIFQCELPSFR
jgi:hypothetical protein